MLNSLREWGERRLTRVFALEATQKHLEFRWVCTDNANLFADCLQTKTVHAPESVNSHCPTFEKIKYMLKN
jgi:hypothetical protein